MHGRNGRKKKQLEFLDKSKELDQKQQEEFRKEVKAKAKRFAERAALAEKELKEKVSVRVDKDKI